MVIVMATSGQMTNEELLDFINKTSSINKTPPDTPHTQTAEPDNQDVPNNSIGHDLDLNSTTSDVESVNHSVRTGDIENNVKQKTNVSRTDIEGDADIDEEMATVVDCDKCNGKGVVQKKCNEQVNSPSDFNIDEDLVSILSKDEITNLIHEYRTELEASKKKLEKSDRQLAKANDYNSVLRNMVEQLSSEIHRLKHMKTCDAEVQVDKEDFLNFTTGSVTMAIWKAETDQDLTPMDINQTAETDGSIVNNTVVETEELSIAETIKQTAEAVVQQQEYNHLTDNGYIYDESSGLYYHPPSGYYYDQNKSLFYDPQTGTYYYYDYDKGSYEFHSQVDLQQSTQSTVQEGSSVKNTTEKPKRKNPRKKEGHERRKCTPEKKIFKNRRERRLAVTDKRSKHERCVSNERYRSRDRKSGRKKQRKHADSECSLSESSSRSRSPRNKLSYNERQRKKKRSKHHHKGDGPRLTASAEENDKEVIDISDEDGINTVESFRNILKLKSDGIKRLQRSVSEEAGSSAADNFCKDLDIDGRRVRAQSEGKVVVNISSECSEDDETLKMEPIVIDSDVNDEERISSGRKIKKSDSHERKSKKRKSSHKHKSKHKRKKYHKHQKRSKKHKRKSTNVSGTESGELTDSDIEELDDSWSETNSSNYYVVSDTDVVCTDIVEPECQEMASSWPPCIRIMVTESDCIQVGTFYMITCTGGKIGRENCDINIPDINISKSHADISYKTDSGQYELIDLASQNGTFLNQQRLSPAKIASEPFVIKHGDVIQVGGTVLLCHIHSGTDTCDQCEPGVVLASMKSQQTQSEYKVLSKEERLKQKKMELKQIKKKYGLKNSAYEDNKEVFNNPNYSDKAEERRKTVGSDNPGQKHEPPASVHRPISSGNIGHKLLQKMGWKEGESLGKNNSGLQEPISVNLRVNQSAGLGSSNAGNFSPENVNTVDMKKASRRIQAQQRFKQIDSRNSQSSNITSKPWKRGDTEFT